MICVDKLIFYFNFSFLRKIFVFAPDGSDILSCHCLAGKIERTAGLRPDKTTKKTQKIVPF